MSIFSASQLANWRAFERVRKSGKFNMFDGRARVAAALSPAEYDFTMKNYGELQAAQPKKPAPGEKS